MPIENLLKTFIKNAGTVIEKRGKAIVKNGEALNVNISSESITALIESSTTADEYEVEVTYYERTNILKGNCTCLYVEKYGDTCKHQVALAVQWLLQLPKVSKNTKAPLLPKAVKNNDTVNIVLTIALIDYLSISKHIQQHVHANPIYKKSNPNISLSNNEKKWTANFPINIETSIEWIKNNTLQISCNCGNLFNNYLCVHAAVIFKAIVTKKGKSFFLQFNDYTTEKNKLLKPFGITIDMPEADDFVFEIDNNTNLKINKQPKWLKMAGWEKIKQTLEPKKYLPTEIKTTANGVEYTESCLVILLSNRYTVGFEFTTALFVNIGNEIKKIKQLSTQNIHNLHGLINFTNKELDAVVPFTEKEINELLQKHSDWQFNFYRTTVNELTEKQQKALVNHFYYYLPQVWQMLQQNEFCFYLLHDATFRKENLYPALIKSTIPSFSFEVKEENNFIKIQCTAFIENSAVFLQAGMVNGILLKIEHAFYIIPQKDFYTLQLFADGFVAVPLHQKTEFIQNLLAPLSQNYLVSNSSIKVEKEENIVPQGQVYLSELNNTFLLIKCKWQYNGQLAENEDEGSYIIAETNDGIKKIKRNNTAEKELFETIRSLHPKFAFQHNGYFYLPYNEVMKGGWFLHFHKQLTQNNFSIWGMNELKRFKYNPNTPKVNVSAKSSIDWFDLEIEITYGDVIVPLAELKKALKNKQEYILLADGSLGLLPKEWISKYSTILQAGKINNDKSVSISKFQFTLIDNLYAELDGSDILKQLEEKKQKLASIDYNQTFTVSQKIKATLRHYQHTGFQWLCLLHQMGWGGCLADDMGLGKTVQTIAFLDYIINLQPKQTHLIVCPPSLIYNWETELKKFAPHISYCIHYGNARLLNEKLVKDNRIIITSYGHVRSDIEELTKFTFGYVVLDESHTIKNPTAQITKSVQLLKANNRLVLSGTPMQNNTQDLYAQFNFLNPGMLGNQEFFKTEFGVPIDKNNDAMASAQLKKMLYPFMLRRTKEQVAKDLPDKTESILWCKMEKEQEKIYNSFKEHYRLMLMGKIEEQGLAKSSFYVLEGLTKLRQICDSPGILNEEEKFPDVSAKADLLMQEIEENTGHHKTLVFSQFTTMLRLIDKKMQAHNIATLYLDGKTPAKKRKEMVDSFQNDANSPRVFLISLKAGGVGLNLTAADYVYLIDPWWNPAVEQQAIDRTHRIGQTNKVFAYKMICKDSIEEKILLLQQKKKSLAANLIGEETGFIKKLNKEDIAYLFE